MATLFLVVCATWVALAPGAYAQSFSNDTFIVPDVVAHDTMFRSLGVERETGTDPIVNGSQHSNGAAFADVNGDGSPDLYVSNQNQPNQLFFNDKKGGFVEQKSGPAVQEVV